MRQSENGIYYWTGTFDKEYETRQYRIVWSVMVIFCLFMVVLGAFLCIPSGDWEMFLAFLLPCITVLLITALVIGIFSRTTAGATRGYRMSENGIWMGYGRSRADFWFDSAKHVIFTKNYIEPVQKIGGFRIYVPEEDMPFVKKYVLQRLPGTCEIEYRP